MIISVNGKIGSGKDTVGKIIQGLIVAKEHNVLNPNFEWIEKYHINSSFEIKKFAGKLKQTASLLTGIPIEKFEDQEFKKTYLGEEWNSPYNIPFSGPDFVEHDGGMTVRTLLQKLGTEAMRDGLHENVWVNALFADYRPQPNKAVAEFLAAEGLPQSMNAGEENYPNWIITDMRFPNEMKAILEKGGITIRVVRRQTIVLDGAKYTIGADPYNEHPSETALDDAEFDYEIINDGTIEDLIEKVKEILIKENII
jgi:hypothetical protein